MKREFEIEVVTPKDKPSGRKEIPSMEKTTTVCGIPCRLRNAISRRTVAKVLRQIKRRCPKDFARLKSRVRMIRPLRQKIADGTCGEWIGRTFEQAYGGNPFDFSDNIRLQWVECESGVLELLESGQTEAQIMATAAHELGHACSMNEDIERRRAPDDEWGSEAAAEWYGYKWGFGRLLAAARKTYRLSHHGPGPRQTVETDGRAFKLSRNFVYHTV
jgi:hypothetical protein